MAWVEFGFGVVKRTLGGAVKFDVLRGFQIFGGNFGEKFEFEKSLYSCIRINVLVLVYNCNSIDLVKIENLIS